MPAARISLSLPAMPVFSSSRMTDSTISSDSFCGGRPVALQHVEQEVVEVGLAQLGARHVDGQPAERNARRVPFGCLADRLLDDDAADLRHQAGLFRDRDELAGRDHAALGLLPAHQRLDAGDRAVGQRDLRLEVDAERALGDGDLEVALELLAVLELAPQLLGEEGVVAAAELLGGIEREIGMDDEVLRIVGVDRIDGDAGAGARQDGRALEADRLVDARQDALGDAVDVLAAAGARQDHDELVAAEAHAEIGGAAGFAHALGGDDQHVVAGGMAERVVDLLEAVEVELDHGEPLAAAVRGLEQRVEMVGQEGAVVQAGQPVMDGDEGHGIARVDELVRAPQDHLRHRPEDEQRHQHDDADGGVEQRPVHAEHLVETRLGERVDAVAERLVAGERRVGHGLVELRPLLAGEIAGAGLVHAEVGLDGGDEAPAIGRQPHREIVEVEGFCEQHVLDRAGSLRAGDSGSAAVPLEQLVVVFLEGGGRFLQRARSAAGLSSGLASSAALARKTTRCDSAFCPATSDNSASSRCCAPIICCSSI